MKKLNKKAFTIVELVIVIAVIAVLAAVLIPTFASLVRKSKVSNDNQIVRNLNTALRSEDSNKHQTPQSVVELAEAYGYNIGNLNAKANNNEILWDSVNDVFCYLNDGEVEYLPDLDGTKLSAGDYRLWKFYNTAPPISGEGKCTEGYSIYVCNDDVADALNNKTINVGIDYGMSTVENLTYKSADDGRVVTIRTNGGNLTIDAKGESVKHYGDADTVDVKEVAMSSYHENGRVALMKVTKGNIVAEVASRISTLFVEAATVKINVEVQAVVNVIATVEDVTPIEIKIAGEVLIADSVVVNAEAVAEVVEEVKTEDVDTFIEKFEVAAARYAGGDGSEKHPYLLTKFEHIDTSMREDISVYDSSSRVGNSLGKFYKMAADIDLGANFVPLGAVEFEVTGPSSVTINSSATVPFQGSFDGDGHTLTMRQNNNDCACLFYSMAFTPVGGKTWNWYFKNVNFDVDLTAKYNSSAVANTIQPVYTNVRFTMENVTVRGSILGQTGAAGLVMSINGSTGAKFTLKDITNYASVTTKKFNGSNYVLCCGIVGTAGVGTKDNEVDFINCRNEGDLVCDITDESVLSKVNTAESKYFSIMGHICGQLSNTSLTSGKNAVMKFINCSFKDGAKLEGYSAKNSKRSDFEGYDRSVGKNTYTGSANFNKRLIGGTAAQNVYVGATLDDAVLYSYMPESTSLPYFAHGGTAAAPGRTNVTTANYPA